MPDYLADQTGEIRRRMEELAEQEGRKPPTILNEEKAANIAAIPYCWRCRRKKLVTANTEANSKGLLLCDACNETLRVIRPI